ncbi:protein of unknown function (plasmid) [Cupriavidus neocaledonicus]|uniref:Uncharacterized protein n=1 Tax=Cupriavidus neocaledonicus TaxID=1040979 RepID=A0A375HKG4_9BURK|nr:hypothetical protein CBM2605_B170107 [Cupriavidus neocaledonicus]SPD58728.1 protein of unknown function [Cupriavidus neocaledonicus]
MCADNKVVQTATISTEKGTAKNSQTGLCTSFPDFIDKSGRWLVARPIVGGPGTPGSFFSNGSAPEATYNRLPRSETPNIPSRTTTPRETVAKPQKRTARAGGLSLGGAAADYLP